MKRIHLLILAVLVIVGAVACLSIDPPSVEGGSAHTPPLEDGKQPAAQADRLRLFEITKDENANYVVYDLRLDESGCLAEKVLDVYWIMNETDGSREELNRFEKDVYGVTIDTVDRKGGRVVFHMNAMEDKSLEIEIADEGEVETFTMIAGLRAKVVKIHLLIKKTWNPLRPDVKIQMEGLTLDQGAWLPVDETVTP